MIPKIVHYCWFGNKEKPKRVLRNIKSWETSNPDYEFNEWNEKNFNIHSNDFVRKAYNEKEWAFVTDYVRLYAVYNYGGFYFDTDVQLVKSLNEINNKFPSGFMGFQGNLLVASGLGFSALPKDPIIKEMMDKYESLKFSKAKLENISCPIINTEVLVSHGLKKDNTIQSIGDLIILPKEFLSPLDLEHGKEKISNNTIAIHRYDASWMSPYKRIRLHIIMNIKKIMPQRTIEYFRKVIRKVYTK